MRDATGGTPEPLHRPSAVALPGAARANPARALAGDTSIRAFDLSNEIDDAQRLPSRDAGWVWWRCSRALRGVERPSAGAFRRAPAVVDERYAHAPRRSRRRARRRLHACLPAVVAMSPRAFWIQSWFPLASAPTAELSGSGRAAHTSSASAPRGGRAGRHHHRRLSGAAARAIPRLRREEGALYYERVLGRLASTGAAVPTPGVTATTTRSSSGRAPFDHRYP